VYIDSNGRVGIGDANPVTSLDVRSSINTSTDWWTNGKATIFAYNTDASGDGILKLIGATGTQRIVYGLGANADKLIFSSRQAENDTSKTVLIDNNGNVGIGTNNPQRPLHVLGANAFIRIESTSTSQNSQLDIKSTAATWSIGQNQVLANTGTLEFYNGSSSPVVIKTNGNVGIGTTGPEVPLDVTNSRSTGYSNTQDQRGLAHIVARNGSDAAGRFSSISWVSGGGTQAEGSINLVQTGNYVGDFAVKLRTGANSTDWRERVRITANGEVVIDGGIGVSSSGTLHIRQKGDTQSDGIAITSSNGTSHRIWKDVNGTLNMGPSNDTAAFNIDLGSRKIMRSNATWAGITNGSQSGSAFNAAGDWYSSRATNTNSLHVRWYNTNGLVGNISTNGSSTLYNTSSDHRLKENVVDLTGAITRLNQLEPKRFNFIADSDTIVDGFIAHEVQSIVPEAITGTYNEVDSDSNPVYQSIDQSKLVPLLTAAIKEQQAIIDDLKARIEALEG
jgi:hypothetical protein